MFRWLNVPLAALFLFAAALQFNDPDPVQWVAIYAAAAVVCGLATTGRVTWKFPALVAAVALLWGALLASHTIGKVDFVHVFDEFKMTRNDELLEEARELVGLLIVAGWCGAVAVWARRRR